MRCRPPSSARVLIVSCRIARSVLTKPRAFWKNLSSVGAVDGRKKALLVDALNFHARNSASTGERLGVGSRCEEVGFGCSEES